MALLLGGVLLEFPNAAQAAGSTLAFSPATGTNMSSITVSTSGPCTDPNATNLQVTMTGSGFSDPKVVVSNSSLTAYQTNTAGGYIVPLAETMQDFANGQNPPATLTGEYKFDLSCRKDVQLGSLGDFNGSIWFTSATAYQDTLPAQVTKLALKVASNTHVAGSSGKGQAKVTLKATVTPVAAGKSVTFYRRSGMTGVVVPAGNAAVDSSGVATRIITGPTGGIQLIYSVLQPNQGYPQVRSNDVSYKFK